MTPTFEQQIHDANVNPPSRSDQWEESPTEYPKPFDAVHLPTGQWGLYYLDYRIYVLRGQQLVIWPDVHEGQRYRRKRS